MIDVFVSWVNRDNARAGANVHFLTFKINTSSGRSWTCAARVVMRFGFSHVRCKYAGITYTLNRYIVLKRVVILFTRKIRYVDNKSPFNSYYRPRVKIISHITLLIYAWAWVCVGCREIKRRTRGYGRIGVCRNGTFRRHDFWKWNDFRVILPKTYSRGGNNTRVNGSSASCALYYVKRDAAAQKSETCSRAIEIQYARTTGTRVLRVFNRRRRTLGV